MEESSKTVFISVILLLAISNYAVSTVEHFFLFFDTFFQAQLKGKGLSLGRILEDWVALHIFQGQKRNIMEKVQ